MMIAYRGANEFLKVDLFTEEVFSKLKHLHISSIHPEIAYGFIVKAKKYGKTISYDPGGSAALGFDSFLKLFKYLDFLLVNKTEIKLLTRISNLNNAIDHVLLHGVKYVIVKLGKNGSLIKGRNVSHYASAFKVRSIDTTGAGDAFNAGFIFGFLKGLPLDLSLVLGNLVAALKIQRRGARASPYLKEVINFALKNELHELVSKLKYEI